MPIFKSSEHDIDAPSKEEKDHFKKLKRKLRVDPFQMGRVACKAIAEEKTSLWTAKTLISYLEKQADKHGVSEKKSRLSYAFQTREPSIDKLAMLLECGFTLCSDTTKMRAFIKNASLQSIKYIFENTTWAAENLRMISSMMDVSSDEGRVDVCAYLAETHNARLPYNFSHMIVKAKAFESFEKNFHALVKSQNSGGLKVSSAIFIALKSDCEHLRKKVFEWASKQDPIEPYDQELNDETDFLELENCAKTYGCEEALAKRLSVVAASNGYLTSFQNWYAKAVNWDEEERVKLIYSAIPHRWIVETVLEDGNVFKSEQRLNFANSQFRKTNSPALIKALAETPNGRSYLNKHIDYVLRSADFDIEYFKICLKALNPSQKEMQDYLGAAMRNEASVGAEEVLLEVGLDLSKVDGTEAEAIILAANYERLEALFKGGLAIGRCYMKCMNEVYQSDKKALIKTFYHKEQDDLYPKWEIQDENTVAELSFVRGLNKGSFVILRRAFNFRAGTVDHTQEMHDANNGVRLVPSNSVPMKDIAPQMVDRARQELDKRGGNSDPYTIGRDKKASPLRIAKK